MEGPKKSPELPREEKEKHFFTFFSRPKRELALKLSFSGEDFPKELLDYDDSRDVPKNIERAHSNWEDDNALREIPEEESISPPQINLPEAVRLAFFSKLPTELSRKEIKDLNRLLYRLLTNSPSGMDSESLLMSDFNKATPKVVHEFVGGDPLFNASVEDSSVGDNIDRVRYKILPVILSAIMKEGDEKLSSITSEEGLANLLLEIDKEKNLKKLLLKSFPILEKTLED
jgi:hypothetical protein